MPRTIDYWFSLVSPWAFLGHQAFLDLAKQHGVTVTFKPVELSEVFPHTGGLPLPKRHPARQRYRILELQRWREARGIPLKIRPKHWPFPVALANRTVTAVAESGADAGPYTGRVFSAVWAQDRDCGDEATLATLLRESGHDADKMLAQRKIRRDRRDLYSACAGSRGCERHRLALLRSRWRGVLGTGPAWDCWRARSRAAARGIAWMPRCEAACR